MIRHTDKEIFEILFRYARNHKARYPLAYAYTCADSAVDSFFANFDYGAGIQRVLEISRAVLWAMHWKFQAPRKDKKWWQSELHFGFKSTETETRVWFQPIKERLPA